MGRSPQTPTLAAGIQSAAAESLCTLYPPPSILIAMLIGPPLAEAVVWYFSTALYLLMPPPIGVAYLIVLLLCFAWRMLLRPAARHAPYGDVGLRLIGRDWPWLSAAILTGVVLYVAFFSAARHLIAENNSPWQVMEAYRARPFGRLADTLVTIAGAPLMEEFVFRGVVQHSLTRRFGPAIGIAVAALLFAMVHLQMRLIPDLFVFGALAGLLVHRTGSLWAGIATHAALNGSLLAVSAAPQLAAFSEDPSVAPFGWCIAALVVSTLIFVALLSRIRRASVGAPHTLDPIPAFAADGSVAERDIQSNII